MTYFMTPKVKVTFVVGFTLFLTPKGHRVIKGRRDLLYDPKSHGDLCGLFDLHIVNDPKKVTGSLGVAVTYFITPKVNLTFDLGLDLRVKHLSLQVTRMSGQHYNAIKQSRRSILPEHVATLCSFLFMLTIALHRVIR